MMGRAAACDVCYITLQLLVITPCGHLLCPGCVARSPRKCASCDAVYAPVRCISDASRLYLGCISAVSRL